MAAMTADDRSALIVLQQLPGVGPATIRRLVDRFGGYVAALERATSDEIGDRAVAARRSKRVWSRAERVIATLAALRIEMIVESDERYPTRLRHLDQPPHVLYARGDLTIAERPCVAVVGARHHTQYGADVTRDLAAGLARAGAVVVSGLARGIDGIAHRATLDSGGTTIAVLGSGCDVPYPHDHETLLREVAETGLVLTEFLPGEPPRRGHFPRRNRLIAALSLGVVVVEAGVRSGSLITVGHALELGREVFAVPGPVTRNTSAGTNALVRDGATVVLGVEDVIEGLRRAGANVGEPVARTAAVRRESATATTQTAPHDMGEFPTRVLAALSTEPRSAEAIAGESSLDPGTTLSALLELELGGFARQLPGFRFVRA